MSTATVPAAAPEHFVRDRSWAMNFLVTLGVAVVCVVPLGPQGFGSAIVLSSLLLCSSLLVRRQLPALAVAWASAAALLQVTFTETPTPSIIVVPLIVYAAARWSSRTVGLIALLIGLVGSVLGPFRWITSTYSYTAIAFAVAATACAAIVSGAYLLGRRLQDQQESVRRVAQSEAERERLRQAEAEQRSKVAAVDERSRIARELHDIVAHSLSVIVVQAEGGRAVVLKKPEVGAEVLNTIASTGRDALGEMRRIVDLLRGETSDGYLPSPGLDDIAELVQRSGDQFELITFGEPPVVGQAFGLTAFRIVQESLTNVIKHAGPAARARVTLAYTPQTVEIDIVDDGRGAAADLPASGHGLQGMAERVSVLGGRLTTGPQPGGGFRVRASLPLEQRP